MGTLGRTMRNGRKSTARRVELRGRAHPAIAKLAVALTEYKEAIEQQAATADILRALSRSSSDPQPVFEAIVEHAHRLCGAVFSILYSYDGQVMNVLADRVSAKASRILHGLYPAPPRRDHIVGRCILEGRVIHSPDVPNDPRFPANRNAFMKAVPFRAGLEVPLLRNGTMVGAIAVGRLEPKAFTKKEISLLKTFADQAVIALENVRLFNETKEALEHQKASADILRIVAGSVENTDPVFEAITSAGTRLIPGVRVSLVLARDGQMHYVSHSGVSEERRAEVGKWFPMPLERNTIVGTCIIDKHVMHVADVAAVADKFPLSAKTSRASGSMAMLAVPLVHNREAIGSIVVSREAPGPFTEKQIALAQTFADQAVIAIRNAKMFREIQERNAELKQALEFQGASGEILASISSSIADTKPVFDAIVRNVVRLFDTKYAAVFMLRGEQLELAALKGDPFSDGRFAASFPQPVDHRTLTGKVLASGKVMQLAPIIGNPEASEQAVELARRSDYNAMIIAPMIREGRVIGAIGTARTEPIGFDEKQVALLKAFADQAVIAIENARLFNETKEALQRQTATSEILKVISSSPTDVQPAFDAIAANGVRLCNAGFGIVFLMDGELIRLVAHHNLSDEELQSLQHLWPMPAHRESIIGRTVLERRILHVHDYREEFPKYASSLPTIRSIVTVPMLKAGNPIGVLAIFRRELAPFTQQQIELLQTFADQAVIAIENVRLFNETKDALERQTATAEILRVISSTPTDVQPVFDAIVQSAQRLMAAKSAILLLRREVDFFVAAYSIPGLESLPAEVRTAPLDRDKNFPSQVMLDRKIVHVPDWEADDVIEFERFVAKAYGIGSGVQVPLVRKGEGIGSLAVTRATKGPFSEKEIALLRSFADQAVIAIENVRLFNETKEALEHQTATSEILRVMSSSPSDVQPVFDTIARNTSQLCKGNYAIVTRFDGELIHLAAEHNPRPGASTPTSRQFPRRPGRDVPSARAVLERNVVHIPNVEQDPDLSREMPRAVGAQSFLAVPMLREGWPIGAIGISRSEPGPFPPSQINLVKVFADQAVIAIENVRLFNETKESLDQQTAASEILSVISRSQTDVQPVFDIIAANALRLCDGSFSLVARFDGELIHLAALHKALPEAVEAIRAVWPQKPGPATAISRAVLTRKVVHIADIESDPEYEFRALGKAAQFRSVLAVPMLKGDAALGAVSVARPAAGHFSERQVALLRTFADQAVIAIENVRLFTETKESLEQQTAIAEVLRVISSSPTDVKPVLDAVAMRAARICEAFDAIIFMREDDRIRHVAHFGDIHGGVALGESVPLGRDMAAGRAIVDGVPVHIEDLTAMPPAEWGKALELQKRSGHRTMLAVPLMRENRALGSIVLRRMEVRPFTEKQIALLNTFADQAAIAIENVRLFNETKEALEQQKASAEILKVIASSPSDVQPVFDALAETAARVCGANDVIIRLVEGDRASVAAHFGSIPITAQARSVPITQGTAHGRAILGRRTIHVEDIVAEFERGEYRATFAFHGGSAYRTLLVAPLLREGGAIGAIVVRRVEKQPFSEKQVALLETFANQAVIAIENVRLFKELQDRTDALTKSVDQLTALGEVGQAISSTLDLETVLKTIVSRAVQLTGLDGGTIYEYEESSRDFHLRAAENMPDEMVETYRRMPIRLGEGIVGGAAVRREPVQVPDIQDESYQTRYKDLLIRQGYRAILAVPLLRDEEIVGALTVSRGRPGSFPPEVIELLKTFAAQSALAIQNARLFREIAEKGKQLEVAGRHKSDFLASMSHELRTPLNALLGFNELILGDVYGEVPADMKPPLVQMQSSGKHLLRLINNVLDLAKIEAGRMELALSDYSVQDIVEGVRSTLRPLAQEKGVEFLAEVPSDIPLAHGDAGRITQCLMNLAGNSLKFTKAGKVEISVALNDGRLRYRVADTGIGIPPEKIENLFTEFKQTDATIASEYGGTGLGLSISKKFVELHGGRIWAQSEPGKGSAFTFEVPLRAATP